MGAGIGEVEVTGHDRSSQLRDLLEAQGWTVIDAVGAEDDATRVLDLRVGYRFNPYFGLELSYWDLGQTEGEFQAVVQRNGSTENLSGSLESQYRTWALGVIGSWPVFSWLSLNGKLGGHRWLHQMELRGTDQAVGADREETGYAGWWALGLEIGASEWLGFDFYWQRFMGVEDEDGIDAKMLGIVIRF